MQPGLGFSGPGVVTTLAPAVAISPSPTCLGLMATGALQQLQLPHFQQQQQVQGVMQLLQQQQQQLPMHSWPQ
jgi:hypothetical protein